jgi:hypothetical protein
VSETSRGLLAESCITSDDAIGHISQYQLIQPIKQTPLTAQQRLEAIVGLRQPRKWQCLYIAVTVPSPSKNFLDATSAWRQLRQAALISPGVMFAKTLLEAEPGRPVYLVSNARGGTSIKEWAKGGHYYAEAVRRSKAAGAQAHLAGILWHQGESDQGAADSYLGKLQALVGNLRSDFNDPNLPFIAGQIQKGDAINEQIAKLPETTHATAYVSSQGLTTTDGTHFDTKSQLLLGERYAAEMLRVQATLPPTPKPPSDIKFIDPHVHAMSVTPLGLRAVAKWMDERNVERCIVSPLNHKGSRPQTEEEHASMLANFLPYKGKIDRMAIIDAGEVETTAQAVAILEKEKAEGAIAFGEHYGVGLMFDDPKNLMLYEACEKVGLPVMFHIDQNKNMVEPGMERVDRVLKMFPKCKVIAHAYWWRQLQHADRQLQEHPNLYADMSGAVVVQVLNRDRKFAREFLIRNQDKILWATDEGWWSFGNKDRQMNQHYTFFEELDLPDEVRHKIYRGNAEKVYGLK